MARTSGAGRWPTGRSEQRSLEDDGALDGSVKITYSGYEAINRRFDARKMDEVARRHALEDELRGWIHRSSEVQLLNQPEWSHADPTLTAEFHVRVKEWTTVAGQRLLCPEGLFSDGDQSAFQSETRVHDLYFPFPRETRDSISIAIPNGYHIEALPAGKSKDLGFLTS